MSNNVAEVIKNIKYFVSEILSPAYRRGNWSTESVKNGLQWANYCEMVASENNLQPCIEMALRELETKFVFTVSLLDIKRANEVLLSALIFNQLIPVEIKNDILSICSEILGESKSTYLANICKEKHQLLKKVSTHLQESSFDKYFKAFKIRAIIEYCKISKDFSKLNCILQSKGSLHQMLSLLNNIPDNERTEVAIVYGQWINSELEKNSSVMIKEIAMLPKEDLMMLCHTFNHFKEKMLNSIKESGEIIFKKNNFTADAHYKDIVLLLQSLLSSELHHLIINSVSKWLAASDGYFWRNVYSDALSVSS